MAGVAEQNPAEFVAVMDCDDGNVVIDGAFQHAVCSQCGHIRFAILAAVDGEVDVADAGSKRGRSQSSDGIGDFTDDGFFEEPARVG